MPRSHTVLPLGKNNAGDITSTNLCGNLVGWCESINYLGVHIQPGTSIKFDINPAQRALYAACSTIFLHSSGVNEIALLKLQETFNLCMQLCMPCLRYVSPLDKPLN